MMKLLRAAGIGVLCGLLVAGALLARPLLARHREARLYGIGQDQLTRASGQGDVRLARVALSVLLDGEAQGGMAASVDGRNWYAPRDGLVNLSVQPGYYAQVSAAVENRVLVTDAHIQLGSLNRIALDVNDAPKAPEYLSFDMTAGQDMRFAIAAVGAQEIELIYAPDGVSVIQGDGQFVLAVDARLSAQHFLCFAAKASNPSGYAHLYIGLRGGNEQPITEIRTVAELSRVRERLSGRYLLMNDIDMSAEEDWQPIGSGNYPFTGVFDGGGHEISGLRSDARMEAGTRSDGASVFALFGSVKNAVIENVVMREPRIACSVPPESGMWASALAASVEQSLIQRCAVFGGRIAPAGGGAGGLMANAANSVLLDLFNSADVVTDGLNSKMFNTGGIVGGLRGYIARCANEGDVTGTHLTGGITGICADATITHCVNSGRITGAALVGEFPPGGLVQTLDAGSLRYSCFSDDSATVGGKVFWGGTVNSVEAIAREDLRSPEALSVIGSFEGNAPDWAFLPELARGPVPYGVAQWMNDRKGR